MISWRSDSALKLFPNPSTLFNELATLTGKKRMTVQISSLQFSVLFSIQNTSDSEKPSSWNTSEHSLTFGKRTAINITRPAAGRVILAAVLDRTGCYLYLLCWTLINSSLHLCWRPQQPLGSQPSLVPGYTLFHPAQGWPKCYTGPRWKRLWLLTRKLKNWVKNSFKNPALNYSILKTVLSKRMQLTCVHHEHAVTLNLLVFSWLIQCLHRSINIHIISHSVSANLSIPLVFLPVKREKIPD